MRALDYPLNKMKIGFISLGCPKNLVDSEVMIGILKQKGCVITNDIKSADAVVVNTCSFIDDAKNESVAEIEKALKAKRKDSLLIVAGCLAQLWREKLQRMYPEINAVIGVDEIKNIDAILNRTEKEEKVFRVNKKPEFLYDHSFRRVLSTPSHYAYVKIAEGCGHACSFCIIPKLRGKYRSRKISSVEKEVETLVEQGVKEIILVSQDSSYFGVDESGKRQLPELLKKLSVISGLDWIRVMYLHPDHLIDEIINGISDNPKVCKYVDLPLQHISDRVLNSMKRESGQRRILELLERLRKRIPGVAVRTSMIVGYPLEGRKEYLELKNFVRSAEFERLGVFGYSPQEGTGSFSIRNRNSAGLIEDRRKEIMEIQSGISFRKNNGKKSKVIRALMDRSECIVDGRKYAGVGRTESDAPEIDNTVIIRKGKVVAGKFYDVKIESAYPYDLVGEIV